MRTGLLATLVLVLVVHAHGALAQSSGILVSPPDPTVDSVVTVTVIATTDCVPLRPTDGMTVTVAGTSIDVLLRLTCQIPPIGHPLPKGYSRVVGRLPAGAYTVRYSRSVSLQIDPVPIYSGPVLIGSLPFIVADSIPTLSTTGLVLLAALALLIVVRARSTARAAFP